ncbi:MauE/DoxX family redox-associated membrane protein [Paenibacillus chitinolyticus]
MELIFYYTEIFFSFVFIISSVGKTLDFENFINFLTNEKLLGNIPYRVTAFFLILLEAVLGLSFSLHLTNRFSYFITFILMMIFFGFFIKKIIMKVKVNCNCFGVTRKETNNIYAAFRNLLFGIVAISCLFYYSSTATSLLSLFESIIIVNLSLMYHMVNQWFYYKDA